MARPRLITDEQILTTMRACVLERGASVSLDVVAERLGVTSPALLKRFGNRQELMLKALLPPESPGWMAEFDRGPDDRPLEQQLADHFNRLWAFFEEVVPCVSALRESGVPHEKMFEGKRNAPVHSIRAISRWLEKARHAGLIETDSPESAATAILGSLQTRAFTAHIAKLQYSTRSNREYLDDLVHLFTRALAPSQKAQSKSTRRTA
jgi:AcrR family transcriptional regulator